VWALLPDAEEDDYSVSDLVPFRVVEGRDQDGVLRITLIGELDLAVADRLSARLDQLSSDRTRVRLDLSRLTFIDSGGIRVLIRAAQHAPRNGEQLIEFARDVTQNVETVIGLVGAAPDLWPSERHGSSKNPCTTSQDESQRNTASQAGTPFSD
jgi:anti-anti-sigma factor